MTTTNNVPDAAMNPAPDPAIALASQAVTSLMTCCKLTLRDGTVLGYTNNTEPLLIDGLLYKATTLQALTSIETTNSFSVDNLDVSGLLSSVDIKEHDLLAGRYDFAAVEVFTVHDENREQKVMQKRGWLGEVTVQDGKFVAEIRGLAQKLQCNIGELYSPTCRATFGDKRCRAPLQEYTHTGVVDTVDSATNRQSFKAQSIGKPDGYFVLGQITWLTGNNAGLKMEIKEYTSSQFILVLAMPQPIKSGDKFSAVAGCDKVFATCCGKFRNAVNFRGEPHVPGKTRLGERLDGA